MQALFSLIVGYLNFYPGIKTKAAAVAALCLAVVAAWDTAVPGLGLDTSVYAVHIPDVVNAFVLALLGVGAANQPKNNPSK